MSKQHTCGIEDLFSLFDDILSTEDVLTSKLMAQISTAISKERIKLGMNQNEFAEYIGATQSQISRWEHGDYNFSIKKIAEIASKLNLDVNISMSNISSCKLSEECDYTRVYPQAYTIYYSKSNKENSINSTYTSKINSKSISIQCK